MKLTKLAAILAVAAAFTTTAHSQVIANWTFENTAVAPASGSTFSYGPADGGAQTAGSSAIGFHTSAATAWSFPAGQAPTPARAFSSNTWAVGDYYQFSLDSTGFSNLSISFGVMGSSTGPRDFQLQYSIDGTNFLSAGTYMVTTAFVTQTFDLSGIAGLNNNPNIAFRLVNTSTTSVGGTTVGTGGTSRVDNFTVTAVPEPGTYMLLGIGALLCVQRFRRNRK